MQAKMQLKRTLDCMFVYILRRARPIANLLYCTFFICGYGTMFPMSDFSITSMMKFGFKFLSEYNVATALRLAFSSCFGSFSNFFHVFSQLL